jgi:Holliday junction resolvase RusA-like endonuclease
LEYKLIIEGRLADLNEYQLKCRSHWSKGNALKKEQEFIVSAYIKAQLSNVYVDKKVKMHYHWYEPNKKRDLDNISSFGRKVIQDALVKSGVLLNDGWKNIAGFTDSFYSDPKRPRVEVIIEEIE